MSTFKKTKGFADMTGELYEVKLLALLFLRALQTRQQFQLASNMKAAGSFDDVVLTLGGLTVLLQLKHKEKSESVLKLSQLTRHKDFNLYKYLKSYLEIKQRWEEDPDLHLCGRFVDAIFVIYTNAGVDESLVSTAGSAELLNIVTTGGTCFSLSELFDSLPKYKAVLSAAVDSQTITATPELWEVVHKLYNKQAQALPSKKLLQEMLENLEYLGDLTSYEQFISQFYLCTGQTAEKDLDDLIMREINSGTLLQKFLEGVQHWWRTSNCYLTEKSQFWQEMFNACAANIIKPSPAIKVKFLEEHCDIIRQKLTSGNRILYIHTDCIKLSCVKVLQSFETNLLVNVNTLQSHLNEVLAVWRLGMCDILVVEGEITDTKILHKLATISDSKRVVFISCRVEHTQLCQEFKFVSFTDTFCMSQLHFDSQCEVLEHEVVFQGFPVKLNSLADVSFLHNAVSADVVVQLHHTLQIGHKLNDLDPCYRPRTFLRREYVSQKIFKEAGITLAITGISENELAQLVPYGQKVEKFILKNFTIDGTCRYFLIEEETEFTALCIFKKNIHWIRLHEGGFLWIKSKGDMSPVVKHLDQKCVNYAGAEEVIALSNQMVLVVAEPGMGKSTEMCSIAHMIKQRDLSTWVIRVALNQYTSLLSQNQLGAMEFLVRVVILDTEFQIHLFQHQLHSSGKVVIILDGFDEISPRYSEQVFDLLKKFSLSKCGKIFVTSRPMLTQKLQHELCTLAFSFNGLTLDDQNNFMIRYWNQNSINSPKLSKFNSSLLQLMGNSFNDKLKEFTAIPLQCKMLAEVFHDEAIHYCQTGEVRLPQNFDEVHLYDKFVAKKCEVFCRKNGIDTTKADDLIECLKYHFQQNYMSCALVSYLTDEDMRKLCSSRIVFNQNQEFVERFNSGRDKTGIVTRIVNDKAVFVHRTFTEYFVAMWFSKNFNLELNFVKEIYFNQYFEIVKKFLDRILAQGFKLHTFILNEDLAEVKKLLSIKNSDVNQEDKGGRTGLHLAIMNYFYRKEEINYSIVETLLEHGADVNCEDRVLHWRPLQLAEKIRAWSIVDKLLEKQADNTDLVWIRANIENQNPVQVAGNQGLVNSMVSVSRPQKSVQCFMSDSLQKVMYTALCEGYMNLLEFILKYGVSVEHFITPKYVYKTSMLHIAAEKGQLRVVQFLIDQEADVDVIDLHNKTPLMQSAECGHMQVVEYLLYNGASVNARDEYGYSALSYAALKGQSKIVDFLLEHTSYDNNDITAVIWRAGCGDKEAMLYLIKNKIINSQDIRGHTALIVAAILGKHEIVELLLQKGANVEISDVWFKKTPLMWAAEHGHVQVSELIINQGACINARDKYEDTALLLAAAEGKSEIVQLLLQKGADVDIYDRYNLTPLMRAAVRGKVQVVELLISHGSSVNARNINGHNALLLAGTSDVKKLLLQHGAHE